MANYKFRITNVTKNRAVMLVIYVLVSLAILATSIITASLIILSFNDPLGSISIGALCALIIAAAISGFTVSKISGEPKLSITVHIISSVILLLSGLIFGGGAAGAMNALCYCGICALSSLLGKRKAKRPKRR